MRASDTILYISAIYKLSDLQFTKIILVHLQKCLSFHSLSIQDMDQWVMDLLQQYTSPEVSLPHASCSQWYQQSYLDPGAMETGSVLMLKAMLWH